MADSTQYNLSLVITANNKAVEEINKLGTSVDSVKKNVVQLSESTKKTLKTVGVAATAIAGSMVALGKSFVDAALENEPLQRSFERLSESAGIASDEMLQAMRKASKGTVADTKLMSAANTALSLNVVKSADDMATLMEIARVKGQAMGRSMEEALDDIVRGLGRSSPMILDNLGIVIKQSEAQEEYAKQIGKTVNELTEEEKKQALVNAVVKQGKAELLATGELQLTMAERLQIVNAQRENMKNTLGDALLPILQKVLEKVTPIIEKVSAWIEQNPELAVKIGLAITAVAGLVAVLSGLALILPAITTAIGVLTGPIGRVIAAIGLLATARAKDWGGIREKTQDAVERIERILGPRLEKIKAWRKEHGETVMIYVEAFMGAIADTIGKVLGLIATAFSITFQNIESAIELFVAIWNGDREQVGDICLNRVNNIDQILTESFGETRENIKRGLQQFIDDVVAKFTALKDKVKSIVDSIKALWNSTKDAVGGAAKAARNAVSSPFKAGGGDVYTGQSYIVGERGPELFVPNQKGSIVPTNQITNNNGIEINISGISVRNDNDIQAIADEITRRIKLEKNFGIA